MNQPHNSIDVVLRALNQEGTGGLIDGFLTEFSDVKGREFDRRRHVSGGGFMTLLPPKKSMKTAWSAPNQRAGRPSICCHFRSILGRPGIKSKF